MASRAGRHNPAAGRTTRRTVAFAMTAALLAASGLAVTSLAGPAAAEPPPNANGLVADATAPTGPTGGTNPNADDDAFKDVPCDQLPPDNSNNGSPKEQDATDGCAPAPAPEPVAVTAVLPATIAEPVEVLPCGETITTDGKARQPDVEIERLTDADKTSAEQCDPFPYELKAVDRGLRFLKPNGYPFAQFFLDVEWRSEDGDTSAPSYVDFELVKGGYAQEMPFCPFSIRDLNTGEVVGLTPDMDLSPEGLAALYIQDQDGFPGAEGATDNGLTQFACIISRTSKHVAEETGPGHFRVFERIYLLGDVFIRR